MYNNFIYPSNGFFRFSTDNKIFQKNQGFSDHLNIYNGKLYYSLYWVDNIDSLYSINSCNLDGTGVTELYRGYNHYVFHHLALGIYENMAFFIENNILKKIDLKYPKLVTILPVKASEYNIANYTIFYVNKSDNKLYRCDLNGNLITKISDDTVDCISIIDDWVYYYNSSNIGLYRIKQDGTSKELVD